MKVTAGGRAARSGAGPPARAVPAPPPATTAPVAAQRFQHEALLYASASEYVDAVVPFVRDGLAADEPVLVIVPRERLELLRDALGSDVAPVTFGDMAEVGRNPARIIPVWHDFVGRHHPDRPVRGVGEPMWPGRSDAEQAECARHEALLHLAFAHGPAWRLLCPYDASGLEADVIDAARGNHEVVHEAGVARTSHVFDAAQRATRVLQGALPQPTAAPETLAFTATSLRAVRALVSGAATAAGLGPARGADLVLALNELATNSVHYGGGGGVLRVWRDRRTLVCEVSDRGRLDQPLVGRKRPHADQPTGRGLWLVNQLCDLVQLRSGGAGTIVRVHMAPDG